MRLRLLLAVAVAASAFFAVSQPVRFPVDVQVIAHRGDVNPVDGYPENTLEALLLADERNPGRVEFDVQRSADGTWWVIHDSTVDRTTDGTGNVADLTDDYLTALTVDGGVGYRDHQGLRLVTLDQVVDAMSTPVWWELDLKETSDEAHRALAEWVVERGLPATVHISPNTASGLDAMLSVVDAPMVAAWPDPTVEWVSVSVAKVDSRVVSQAGQVVVWDEAGLGWSEAEKLSRVVRAGATAWMTDNLPEALNLAS